MIIVKVYRQHNSLVMSIPVLVQRSLGICVGDHLLLDLDDADHECTMAKLDERDLRNAGTKRGKSKQDTGGGT